jgi:hypothetical protein
MLTHLAHAAMVQVSNKCSKGYFTLCNVLFYNRNQFINIKGFW